MILLKGSRYALLFLVSCFLLASTCDRRIDLPKVALKSLTEAQVISNYELSNTIGKAMQTQINKPESAFDILPRTGNTEIYNYLDWRLNTAIFTNPIAVENRNNFEWSVNVIVDDAKTNAFTFPGGHLYITTGLLKFLDTENQLLTLYSHEIAYADKYYAALALLDIFGGSEIGDVDLNRADEANISVMVDTLNTYSYDEAIVMDADKFSIEVMCPFNYDSGGLEDMLDKSELDGVTIDWMTYKHADITARRQQVNELTFDCGFNGVENANEYQAFLALLP